MSKDIFKMGKDELISLFSDCSSLINEKYSKSEEIKKLESEIDILKNGRQLSSQEVSNHIVSTNRNFEKNFKKLFPILFSIILTIVISLNSREGFNLAFIELIFFYLIGKLVSYVLYKIFEDKIYNVIYKMNHKKVVKTKKLSDETNNKIKNIKRKITKLNEQKSEIQSKLDLIDLGTLHNEYQNYNALVSFTNYLSKGRCDTLKECINLYEDEKSKEKMYNDIKEQNRLSEEKIYRNITESIEQNNRNIENKLNSISSDLKDVQLETEVNKQRHEDYVRKYGDAIIEQQEDKYRKEAKRKLDRK